MPKQKDPFETLDLKDELQDLPENPEPTQFTLENPEIPKFTMPRHLMRKSLKREEDEWIELYNLNKTEAYIKFPSITQAKTKRTRLYHARTYLNHILETSNPELIERINSYSIELIREPVALRFVISPPIQFVDSLD
jgi:hypothetical protein